MTVRDAPAVDVGLKSGYSGLENGSSFSQVSDFPSQILDLGFQLVTPDPQSQESQDGQDGQLWSDDKAFLAQRTLVDFVAAVPVPETCDAGLAVVVSARRAYRIGEQVHTDGTQEIIFGQEEVAGR